MQKFILTFIRFLIAIIGFISPNWAAKIAAYFFARPSRRKNRAWMKEFIDSASNDYFEVDGYQIKSYIWKGESPGILFLHGWKSNAARWKYLINKFQDLNVDLISLDAPGHGESKHPAFTPPNYAEVINPIIEKYQPKIIIAHSVGAYVALYHHAKYQPKNVKYVLMAPTYDIMLPISTMFDILKLAPKIQKKYIENIEKEIETSLESIRADKLVEKYAPQGILIHDVQDKILPVAGSASLAKVADDLEYFEIDSTGHRMQNDEVEHIINEWVRRELN